MNVWVLQCGSQEGGMIIGVFSTEEKAKQYMKDIPPRLYPNFEYDNRTIEQLTIDASTHNW